MAVKQDDLRSRKVMKSKEIYSLFFVLACTFTVCVIIIWVVFLCI